MSNTMTIGGIETQTEGEFANWHYVSGEPFDELVGPFYFKGSGSNLICAFRASARNGNKIDVVHGGALMTFADYSMYVSLFDHYRVEKIVTISMTSEFLSFAKVGDYLEAKNDIVRSGRSLAVVRGMVTLESKPILNYSATFKILGDS